jgi:hypothetical protein
MTLAKTAAAAPSFHFPSVCHLFAPARQFLPAQSYLIGRDG